MERCFSLASLREEGQDLPRCSPICSAALLSWSTSAQAVVSVTVLRLYESRLYHSQCGTRTHLRTTPAPCRSTSVQNKNSSSDQNFICQGKRSGWNICVVSIPQRRKSIKWESFPLRGAWFASNPTFWFACSLLSQNTGKILFRVPWRAEDSLLKTSYHMFRRKRKVLMERVPQAHKNVVINKD